MFPELVHTHVDDGSKGVAYVELIAPLIEAVEELKADNDDLRAEVEALSVQIQTLAAAR